ncbi:MAG TPA: hypothetical protein ENG87_04680 [Candidatus Pacearchaeota archaeon]|nr:hypothetical protein [Candidatus Pacearchaeota archaeon]
MKELILITSYWVHLLATVIWIGGIIFILFIAIPSSKQVMGAESGKLMGEISKRFTPLANYSILLLVVTGILLTVLSKQFSGFGSLGNKWISIMSLKHVIVSVMIAIHFYRGLLLIPKIGKTESSIEKKALLKISLNLVKVNFFFGILVLLLSAISSVV